MSKSDADLIVSPPLSTPAAPAPGLHWAWSLESVMAFLTAAGNPPKMSIQAGLNAAFMVDGPKILAQQLAAWYDERGELLEAAGTTLRVQVGEAEAHIAVDKALLALVAFAAVPARQLAVGVKAPGDTTEEYVPPNLALVKEVEQLTLPMEGT